jgi:hypothetical protein
MPVSPSDLLNDVLTFLCFLHSNDVKPRGERFLPPAALAQLVPLLLVGDAPEPGAPTKERDTGRLRFIHFVCEAAELVARTGSFLKPAPAVAHWLASSDFDRSAQLFTPAFLSASAHLQGLWRAYQLPGWRLPAAQLALGRLVGVLRAAPSQEQISLTTLLKLIALAHGGGATETATLLPQ